MITTFSFLTNICIPLAMTESKQYSHFPAWTTIGINIWNANQATINITTNCRGGPAPSILMQHQIGTKNFVVLGDNGGI